MSRKSAFVVSFVALVDLRVSKSKAEVGTSTEFSRANARGR